MGFHHGTVKITDKKSTQNSTNFPESVISTSNQKTKFAQFMARHKILSLILKKLNSQKGAFLAILCAMTVSLFGIFYKKAASMSGSDNSTFRYIIQLITMIFILKIKKIPLFGPKEHRKLLLARSFVGIFAVVFANFAINFIEPSDSSAISHTNIILTAIMARIFLKEKLGIQHFIALILTIVGVLLMTKPSFMFKKAMSDAPLNITFSFADDNTTSVTQNGCSKVRSYVNTGIYDRIIGTAFALIGAFGTGAIYVIIRKLCMHQVHYAVNTFYGTFFGLPASILTSVVLIVTGAYHSNFKCEIPHLVHDISFGIIGGIIAVVAQIILNISLQYEDATMVAILRTTDVVFSYLFQFLILEIKPDYISVLGALAILLGTLTILLFKFIKEKLKSRTTQATFEDSNS